MAYGPPKMYDPTDVMGRRIGAWAIDIVIPTLIAVAIGWTVFVGGATRVSNVPTDYCTAVRIEPPGSTCLVVGNDAYVGDASVRRHAFLVGGLIYLVGAANLFLLQGLTGAALGKHMVGLRVVKADGSAVGFGRNAFRTLMLVVDQFACALPGIITASVTHPHRRVGDFAAGTFVVARESVGTPIGAAIAAQAYPPQWTPPPTSWGPPPATGAPLPTHAPPTWGSPAANPPAAETPATWGTPAATMPPPTESAAPRPEDAPGWASPAPVASEPAPQPAPQPVQEPLPQRREPQWDAQRNAWVYWEAETNRWLQHDPATGQWGPLH